MKGKKIGRLKEYWSAHSITKKPEPRTITITKNQTQREDGTRMIAQADQSQTPTRWPWALSCCMQSISTYLCQEWALGTSVGNIVPREQMLQILRLHSEKILLMCVSPIPTPSPFFWVTNSSSPNLSGCK